MLARVAGFLWMFVALGCGAGAPPPAEQDWNAQVQAVRAGEAEEIRVEANEVGDDQVAMLQGQLTLRRLSLGRARITGEGLERIAELQTLELLRLVGAAALDDQSLRHLGEMHGLEHLMLYDVPITDAGLEHLHGLHGLESFYFSGTAITDDGIAELSRALPDLHVHW
ncbi:MAG: hypothetical protein WD079_04565 [Phycisphaeraceae bacterium]